MVVVAVKLIPQGDEPDVVQREHHLHKVANLNGVAPKPGEVLHNDTIHAPGPHQLKQLLDGGPLEVGPTVAVVHELQNVGVGNALHIFHVLVEDTPLPLDAVAAHLAVLGGQPDIEGDGVCPAIHAGT